MAKVNETHRVWLTIKRSNGQPAVGINPADVSVTVRNPADSASSTPAIVEGASAGGLYYFDVPASFTLTHGAGSYGILIDIDSSSPKVRDTSGVSVPFTEADHDDIQVTALLAVDLALYQGSVWVDSANGNPGTVVGTNGLPSNPVDNLADALTLAGAIGFRSFIVVTGSLTLLSSLTEWHVEMRGESEINFNGQSVNGSEFVGGLIKGTMTGRITVRSGHLEDVDGFAGDAHLCGARGTTTLGPGDSHWDLCHSDVPGTQTPTIKFGNPTSEMNLRGYMGGIQIEDMTLAAHIMSADVLSGQVIVDASCTGGTLVIRGNAEPVTDNSAGTAVTDNALSPARVDETHRYLGLEVGTPVVHTPTAIDTTGIAQTVNTIGTTVTKTRDP